MTSPSTTVPSPPEGFRKTLWFKEIKEDFLKVYHKCHISCCQLVALCLWPTIATTKWSAPITKHTTEIWSNLIGEDMRIFRFPLVLFFAMATLFDLSKILCSLCIVFIETTHCLQLYIYFSHEDFEGFWKTCLIYNVTEVRTVRGKKAQISSKIC